MLKIILWLGALASSHSYGFPEMIRHNYSRCVGCHVSPSGGGVLTPYGRQLSKEVLSTWGAEEKSESKFAYSVIPTPKWLNLMGQYRELFAYLNTPYIQTSQFIFMQNDLEASAHHRQGAFTISAGFQNTPDATGPGDYFLSRRHYLTYEVSENLTVRAGKFLMDFGINTPEHVTPTRKDLGWDQGSETYNLELNWAREDWDVFLTGSLGRLTDPADLQEKSLALVPGFTFGESYKFGLNLFQGASQNQTRSILGAWMLLGLGPQWSWLAEVDLQKRYLASDSNTGILGLVNMQKLDWEFHQGVHVYLTQDFSQLNLNLANQVRNSYGLGLQFFPRPHLEINTSWQKQRNLRIIDSYSDLFLMMLNFYL